jgi:uroporphyrinogen-III synthase
MLAGQKILITRPVDQGESLSAELHAQGAECFVIPAIEIKPISYATFPKELSQYDKFIFISQNAVLLGPQLSQLDRPIYAIGQATAQSLKDKGCEQVIVPKEFSSESFLEQSDLDDVRNENILIICGRGGRRLLEETLRQRGANCQRLEVYQRLYPQQHEQDLQEVLASVVLDFIVVTSEQALVNLVQMAGGSEQVLKTQQLIVIGQRLARSVKALGFNKPAIIVDLCDSASIVEVISNGDNANG